MQGDPRSREEGGPADLSSRPLPVDAPGQSLPVATLWSPQARPLPHRCCLSPVQGPAAGTRLPLGVPAPGGTCTQAASCGRVVGRTECRGGRSAVAPSTPCLHPSLPGGRQRPAVSPRRGCSRPCEQANGPGKGAAGQRPWGGPEAAPRNRKLQRLCELQGGPGGRSSACVCARVCLCI